MLTVPAQYAGLRPEDAALYNVNEGEEVQLAINDAEYLLPVKFIRELAEGIGALPAGLTGLKGVTLPEWINKKSSQRRSVKVDPVIPACPESFSKKDDSGQAGMTN